MNKLKCEQLFAIIFLMRLFWLLSAAEPFSSVTLLGALCSAAVQGLLLVPALTAGRRGMPDGRVSAVLYGGFFVLWGAKVLLRLLEVSHVVAFPMRRVSLGLLLLAAVCVYGARLGLTALARSAVLLFGVSVAALIVLVLGAYPAFDAKTLVTSSASGLLAAAWRDLCDSGGLTVAAVLLCRTGGQTRRAVYGALLGQAAAIGLVSVLSAGVLGRLMDVSSYPFFTLCAFSQPFSVQRSDALFLLLFAALGVFTAAVPLCLANEVWKDHLPCPRRGRLLVLAGGMLVCVWGLQALGTELSGLGGVGCLLLVGLLPCRLLLRSSKQGA